MAAPTADTAPREPDRGPAAQPALTAEARRSGLPVLDAGRGQPNWIATAPRAAFFRLGTFAVEEAVAAGSPVAEDPYWGRTPVAEGIADRLVAGLDPADFLRAAVDWVVAELGADPDELVSEWVRAILGDGYPSPTRMLRHCESVMERYLQEVTGARVPLRVFGTEGGAAAMAYTFRSLKENGILGPGDKVAIAAPVFTPYLQIPALADFGLEIVEVRAAPNAAYRFEPGQLTAALRDPAIKAFMVINPGNPDTRAMRPERLAELAALVATERPDLVVVADTVYATFVEGFRGLLAEIPRNVICLHSFSKNAGATGNRLGFVALAADSLLDELLTPATAARYESVTADPAALPFVARMVADSREVALHNIAGLATPDQVQMAFFALSHLLPSGAAPTASLREELAARAAALLGPLGVDAPGGQDTLYYALVDLEAVARVRHGEAGVERLRAQDPTRVPVRLAHDHGVVVLPGAGFGAPTWDVRVCLAALPADALHRVAESLTQVVDALTT
ncbi:bifunctional aspartate transaminase/aspartate 4-decarboxylase [Pseudonocardia oroxyli]|uniref:Aminotransferase n=1 Tax=Pseudonocardia oroxyli TaxID=366584 RepID=A0A1G7DRW6_PSEOR|nr:bifunctional aspartate transaminase/aspartate 4-decarboxylase [Pseudonocardia oroxyli]SDE54213.1 aspartate 4-decarboxylase [Pseudonocardia oroxyli]